MVISTYGMRSDWIRNLAKTPRCHVTVDGVRRPARAEIVTDLSLKHRLVTDHPFFPAWPSKLTNALCRPLLPAGLRRWVIPRPVVVFHLDLA
jgi:hypothetical protein